MQFGGINALPLCGEIGSGWIWVDGTGKLDVGPIKVIQHGGITPYEEARDLCFANIRIYLEKLCSDNCPYEFYTTALGCFEFYPQ